MTKLKVFTQDNCPTCNKLKNLLKDMDIKEVEVIYIDQVLENKNEFEKYSIFKTPASVLTNEKDEEIDRFYGAPQENKIIEFIKQ